MCFKLKNAISLFSIYDLASLTIYILQKEAESDHLHQSGFNSTISTYHFYHLCKNNLFLPTTSHNNKLSSFPQNNAFQGSRKGRNGEIHYTYKSIISTFLTKQNPFAVGKWASQVLKRPFYVYTQAREVPHPDWVIKCELHILCHKVWLCLKFLLSKI